MHGTDDPPNTQGLKSWKFLFHVWILERGLVGCHRVVRDTGTSQLSPQKGLWDVALILMASHPHETPAFTSSSQGVRGRADEEGCGLH